MRINELVTRSGDSKLISYHFSNGVLEVSLEIDDIDDLIVIKIPTNFVHGEKFQEQDKIFATCRIDLIELGKILDSTNGYYIPNSDFGKMMKETRGGASLAYGQNCAKFKWLFRVTGYSHLISCLSEDLDKINCYGMEVIEA
jgi:hypothetical protein